MALLILLLLLLLLLLGSCQVGIVSSHPSAL
jgi:hypothetical protein